MSRSLPFGHVLVLGMGVLVFGLLAYQPGYFGDELFPFFVAKTSRSVGEVFLRINDYKPRLIFNAIWTALAWERAPRYVAAVITWVSVFWAAWAAHAVARRILGASPLMALGVGAAVVISRFGTVFYYDYLSGIIGGMGLAMFLSTLLVMAPVLRGGELRTRRAMAFVAMSIATLFVYEVYIAPLFVLGVAVAIIGITDRKRSFAERVRLQASGIAVWLLPLILFVVATHFLSTRSVMTGTAGKPVTLGLGAIKAFGQFFANTFLGTNIGLPWFTGFYNAGSFAGLVVGIVFASVLFVLWIGALFASRGRVGRRDVLVSLTVFCMALSMIAIASLPGPSLSDARWMFPLSALLAFVILSLPSSLPRNLLLCGMLGVSVFHLVKQTNSGIYNVEASRLSGKITRALTSLRPMGADGILLGLQQGQVEWILGGDALQGNDVTSGAVYCWINLSPSPCLDPQSALRRRPLADYDFAVAFAGGVADPDAFYIIPHSAVRLLAKPSVDDLAGARDLGGTLVGWKDWIWRGPQQPDHEDRRITTEAFATTVLPAHDLAGRVIAYEAYADTAGEGRTMRLQVNWLGRRDKLVRAQIKLVELTTAPQVFTMLLDRPKGAKTAEVYATMHDEGAGTARIKSVKLLSF